MSRTNNAEFSQYLQSIVKLEELQQMTEDLDKELEDSQRVMSKIKTLYNSIPNVQINRSQQNNGRRHEDLAQFLDADVPNLLMPDMPTVDVDLDNVKVMKSYAEDLRNNFVAPNSQQEQPHRKLENLDLDQYVSSLDEMNMKLNKTIEGSRKNDELEATLTQLRMSICSRRFSNQWLSLVKLTRTGLRHSTTVQLCNMSHMFIDSFSVNMYTYLLKKNQ